jgi:hypothetical protein
VRRFFFRWWLSPVYTLTVSTTSLIFGFMADLDTILRKLDLLGLEDTKRVGEAVRAHLEELDEIAAYDAAKAKDEPT